MVQNHAADRYRNAAESCAVLVRRVSNPPTNRYKPVIFKNVNSSESDPFLTQMPRMFMYILEAIVKWLS